MRSTPITSSGKVRIDRSSDSAGAAADLEANAYTAGDTIVLPQHHGPLDRGRGQALLAHELVHVGQQRRLGTSLPAEHTSAGQQLEREAQSAESMVERARKTTASDMPLARTGPQRSVGDASASHANEVRQASQLALATGTRSSSPESIELPVGGQEASAVHGATPQRAALGSASSRSMGTTAPAAAGDGTAGAAKPVDDEDFDELARKLYERLRLRFKRELLLDRERGGFLADSR